MRLKVITVRGNIFITTKLLCQLAQIEYALNLSEPISLGIVRRHYNKGIWLARHTKFQKLAKCQKMATPCPYLGKILSREPKDLGSSFWYQNVRNRLSRQPLFTRFEKKYLAFLNILAKCDFLEKMTLGPCRIIFEIS